MEGANCPPCLAGAPAPARWDTRYGATAAPPPLLPLQQAELPSMARLLAAKVQPWWRLVFCNGLGMAGVRGLD